MRANFSRALVLALLALVGVALGQFTRTYTHSAVLDPNTGLTISWNMAPLPNPTMVEFGVSGAVGGYISVGFSAQGTMANLDCMMCYTDASGAGFFADYWVSGYNTPTQDSHQDYTNKGVKRNGANLYCEFDRLISNSADPTRDFLLSTSNTRATNIVWAIHTTARPVSLSSWQKHTSFGNKQAILCTECTVAAPPPVTAGTPVAAGTPTSTSSTGGVNQTHDGIIAAGEYPSHVSLSNGNFDLYWRVEPDGQRITFGMTANGMGYVALGIGTSMTNSDNMVGYFMANPNGGPDILVVDDYWSTGQVPPSLDTTMPGGVSNILSYGGSIDQTTKKITVEFTRYLTSTDTNDQNFVIGQAMDINYAWTDLPSDFLLNHGPKNRGVTQIFISLDGAQTLPPPDRKPGMRLAHLILMYIAFSVLIPGATIFARYGREIKNQLWYKVHRVITIAAFVMGLIGLFVILGGVSNGHFQTASHAQLGIAVLAISLVMLLMGMWRIRTPEPEDTDQTSWHIWYQLHRWLGRIQIALSVAATFTGMAEYNAPQFLFGWHAGAVVTFVLFIFFAEMRTWNHMSKKVRGTKSAAH